MSETGPLSTAAPPAAAELTCTVVRSASHDLKNLLTGLSYATETAIASIEDSQPQAGLQWMNRVLHGLHAAHQRFTDLLTADRLLERRWPWRTEALSTDAILERLTLRLNTHTDADCKRVRIHATGQPVALIDLMLVDFAWGVLLSNAFRFSDSPSIVEAQLCSAPGSLLLRVLDAGIGIPEGECNQDFAPGFRLSNACRRHGPGLGLHLASIATFVHGGSLRLLPRPTGGAIAEAVFRSQ